MVGQRKKLLLRWKRADVLLRVFLLFVGTLLLGALIYRQIPEDDSLYPGSNLLLILFVNFAIVLLAVLLFVIGRNLVKLVFDRRLGIPGTKLRLRLVLAFLGLTIIPTGLLFVLAHGLLNQAVSAWFSAPVEEVFSGAKEVARAHYQTLRKLTRLHADQLNSRLAQHSVHALNKTNLEREREHRSLFAIQIVRSDGTAQVAAFHPAADLDSFSAPELETNTLNQVLAGQIVERTEESGASQFLRVYQVLNANEGSTQQKSILVVTIRLDPELAQSISEIKNAYNQYEQIKFLKNPLRSSNVLLLSIVTAVILFAAIWVAFYIAKAITIPIQQLAEGTKAVARGNYDLVIDAEGDDEISSLVSSFNRMTSDLKRGRDEVERRRLFLESILRQLAVGVIALDRQGKITSLNDAACKIYGIQQADKLIGSELTEILNPEDRRQLEPLFLAISQLEKNSDLSESKVTEREIRVESQGRELKIICTVGAVISPSGQQLGRVLLLDDLTELVKAQHMAAWREVAQRIAHEIKNPLTPIQLSAQRILKLLGELSPEKFLEQRPSLEESAAAIVRNVDSIKRLADEFSRFARMPAAEFSSTQLNLLLSESLPTFAEQYPEVTFQFIADQKLPEVLLDREQIRRVLINLLENAVAAVEQNYQKIGTRGKITIRTNYLEQQRLAKFEVSDNGPGVPADQRARIFEPYFTTKQEGSGLGLAIVNSIVVDHQGEIRLYENPPHGSRFVVELPISPKPVTQRRFII